MRTVTAYGIISVLDMLSRKTSFTELLHSSEQMNAKQVICCSVFLDLRLWLKCRAVKGDAIYQAIVFIFCMPIPQCVMWCSLNRKVKVRSVRSKVKFTCSRPSSWYEIFNRLFFSYFFSTPNTTADVPSYVYICQRKVIFKQGASRKIQHF